MHTIEPYYNWRHIYIASEDERSPFYEREYSEFEYTNTIYNFFIHPQWDDIDSPTLYIKILATDYDNGYAIIELIGEWNDCINNDIMTLKREIIDEMISQGIYKFILIGENILNFHTSDDSYYEEWVDDIKENGGWVVAVNFRDHVLKEMNTIKLSNYINYGNNFNDLNWRVYKPKHFFSLINTMVNKSLGY